MAVSDLSIIVVTVLFINWAV